MNLVLDIDGGGGAYEIKLRADEIVLDACSEDKTSWTQTVIYFEECISILRWSIGEYEQTQRNFQAEM